MVPVCQENIKHFYISKTYSPLWLDKNCSAIVVTLSSIVEYYQKNFQPNNKIVNAGFKKSIFWL